MITTSRDGNVIRFEDDRGDLSAIAYPVGDRWMSRFHNHPIIFSGASADEVVQSYKNKCRTAGINAEGFWRAGLRSGRHSADSGRRDRLSSISTR